MGRLFWKVLAVIGVLLAGCWVLIPRLSTYQITPADYVGSAISSIILAYLIHLWLLPQPEWRNDASDSEGSQSQPGGPPNG